MYTIVYYSTLTLNVNPYKKKVKEEKPDSILNVVVSLSILSRMLRVCYYTDSQFSLSLAFSLLSPQSVYILLWSVLISTSTTIRRIRRSEVRSFGSIKGLSFSFSNLYWRMKVSVDNIEYPLLLPLAYLLFPHWHTRYTHHISININTVLWLVYKYK